MRPKVFCIGFHKTGTKSLASALGRLGYRVAGPNGTRDPHIANNAWALAQSLVNEFDAFQDNPWPILFKELDQAYPGSRFILTLREPRSWIQSQVNYFGARETPMRQWIYGAGSPVGSEARYLDRYQRHNREVRAHFSGRDRDLLVMNLADGDAWPELCGFLDHPVPDEPFPHHNRTAAPGEPGATPSTSTDTPRAIPATSERESHFRRLARKAGARLRAWRPRKSSVRAIRSEANPLLSSASAAGLGDNLNGPSMIRVPDWLPRPLGRYYLYFAHHQGKYIRLAYADSPHGPWHVHEPGTLRLEQATAFHDHIASPDVHIDEERHQIRMYFHGRVPGRESQWSGCAISDDGLNFIPGEEILGYFYFRVWQYRDAWYALAKQANTGWQQLYRSKDGLGGFEPGITLLPGARHTSVLLRGDELLVFYSRKGDAPEHILLSSVDLSKDWHQWQGSAPVEVLRPQADYEGIQYPNKPSKFGAAIHVQQLRDPYVLEDDGRLYLLYSVAGEMGIALADLYIE